MAAEKTAEPAPGKPLYERASRYVSDAVGTARSFGNSSYRVVDARVRSDANAAKQLIHLGSRRGLDLLKKLALFYLAVVVAAGVILAVLWVCLWLASGSSVMLRYYTLRNVAGSQIVPLAFNAMPLFTEWWRNGPVDDAMSGFLPRLANGKDGRGGALDGAESLYGSGGDPIGLGGEDPDSLQSKVRQLTSRLRGEETNSGNQLVRAQGGKLLDFKLEFLQQYVNSVLASSTMYIPTGNAKTLFLPGGSVNMEAIFDFGSPMFNAKGTYTGRVQLVFAREHVGRHVSVVVEGSMLFAEDPRNPQTLSSLDVLFTNTHTVSVRTGDEPQWWVLSAASWVLRLCFYVPMRSYEVALRFVRDSQAAPFHPIDPEHEVAVTVDLYERFAPPVSLQSRLRAINFTVYYNHLSEGSALSPGKTFQRPTLSHMTFYSHVQLRGFAYLQSMYPVTTFLVVTVILFFIYASTSVALVSAASIVLYIYLFSAPSAGDDAHVRWAFDNNTSFSSSGPSHASPLTPFGTSGATRGVRRATSSHFPGRHSLRDTRRNSPDLLDDSSSQFSRSASAEILHSSTSEQPATQYKKRR